MLASLQKLGRALMLPIAVLPVAGILLRLGQPDVWTWWLPATGYFVVHFVPFIGAAGDAIFSNLGLLFAIGVAVGLARENHGAAGLAGLVCFLIATKAAAVLITVPPAELAGLSDKAKGLADAAFRAGAVAKFGVPCGIASGLIAGALYNRFYDIKLPDYLAFFGGRRFVPIVAGFAGLGLALILGLGWPYLSTGMESLTHAVISAGGLGLFLYGALNRLLIVTGLHHILNNFAWFILGDFHGKTGDLNRFFAGDPSAGAFMSGFFPVMMFGLPAACLAMYHAAPKDRRKQVGGMLTSMALTSFLTGVTEPIEFTFMFLAPVLYGVHVLLTGASMFLMDALHIRLGFSFSAGLFDYGLNFTKATRPLWLIPIGLAYFAVYYGLFRFFIARFKLQTPGREPLEEAQIATPSASGEAAGTRADGFIAALGGAANLALVDACTTRLRLEVRDGAVIDEPALKRLGARGLIKPSANTVQVVLGPIADQVAGEIRERMGRPPAATPVVAAPQLATSPDEAPADERMVSGLLTVLGGLGNVRSVEARSTRLLIQVADAAGVDEAAASSLDLRGLTHTASGDVHVIVGPAAASTAEALRRLLSARA